MDIRVMLEHYHMSFSVNYRKREFPFISNHVQEPDLVEGRRPSFRRYEPWVSRTLWLFSCLFQIPLSRVVGSLVMIGRALAHYGSSRICLVFFYVLLVSLRLLEARRKSQDTSYYGHVSIARLSIKDLSFPLLLRFFRRKHNIEDTTHFTHTFTPFTHL